MSVRNDKEKIIREIMDLRTMIDDIKYKYCFDPIVYDMVLKVDLSKKEEAQNQLNKIHNMVFNL